MVTSKYNFEEHLIKSMSKIIYTGHGQGRSMQPVINEGDKLYVEQVKLNKIRVGDIVVFYNLRNLIGHRVIKIIGNQIITKGDNIPYFDKPLKPREILGKIVHIEGRFGTIRLTSSLYAIVTSYFLFYSLTTYYIPYWIRLCLVKLFRGRKILVKLLSEKNFSNKYPDHTKKGLKKSIK